MKITPVILLCALLCFAVSPAYACRTAPPTITLEEAFEKADAVFQGIVVEMKDGLPTDFTPPDTKFYRERMKSLKRQKIKPVARQLIIRPLKFWKGDTQAGYITLIDYAVMNSCDWDLDVKAGHELLVMAQKDGNYLAAPRFLDPLRGHTLVVRNQTENKRDTLHDMRKELDALVGKMKAEAASDAAE